MDCQKKERLPVEPKGGQDLESTSCAKFTKRLQRFTFVAFSILYELAEKNTPDASSF
jgi:hypothetical protein